MDFSDVSPVGVFLAALAHFVLGALWYGPLFGRPWRDLLDIRREGGEQPSASMLISAFLVGLLAVLGVAAILDLDPAWPEGLLTGLLVGVLIATTTLATQYIFEQRSPKLLVINAGYNVVALGLGGAIIAAFQ